MCLSATAFWVANDATKSELAAFPTLNGEPSGVGETLEDAIEPAGIPLGVGAEIVGAAPTGLFLGCAGAEFTGRFAVGEDALPPSASARRSRKSVSRRPL